MPLFFIVEKKLQMFKSAKGPWNNDNNKNKWSIMKEERKILRGKVEKAVLKIDL